jgi:hypothetical protein
MNTSIDVATINLFFIFLYLSILQHDFFSFSSYILFDLSCSVDGLIRFLEKESSTKQVSRF